MKSLIYRLAIGLIGIGCFWAFGMLSAKELAKTSVLMTTCILGLVGLLVLARSPRHWVSGISIAVYLLSFFDTAIKGFLRDYFGLRPNPALVLQAVLNTNQGEAYEFFLHSWRDIAEAGLAFFIIALLAIFAERRLARAERSATALTTGRAGKMTIATMLVLFIAMHFNPTMAKENPALFWPLRYLEYQKQLAGVASMQQNMSRDMAHHSEWKVQYVGAPKHTVVWVIGESVNRFNMSLYGYARSTTPQLDTMRNELIVFGDVVSPAPATMASLMKMLTPADLDHPGAWTQKPNVLMLAKEAGYKTFWLSNHVPNDGWLGLVTSQADARTFINKGAGRGENNVDGNLLPHVADALADSAPRKLIVVHLLGAHPTYDMRYPASFSRFDGLDDAISVSMKQAGRSIWIRHLRDEYDNAILYGDDVLGNLIRSTVKATQDHTAALLYSSDHGQEVGHSRNHAGQSMVDKTGYEIPMVVWTTTSASLDPQQKSTFENRPYQTDRLEHTMLGLLNIRSSYYDATYDVLSDRFIPRPRMVNRERYTLSRQ